MPASVSALVRINGVVHVNSVLPGETIVPIGWVAVGDPARILPPSDHEGIWQVQRELDFVGTVYGIEPASPRQVMAKITRGYAELFGRHRDDRAQASVGAGGVSLWGVHRGHDRHDVSPAPPALVRGS